VQKKIFNLMTCLAMLSLVLFAENGVTAQNQTAGDLPKYGLYLHFGLSTFHGYNPQGKEMARDRLFSPSALSDARLNPLRALYRKGDYLAAVSK
jgi:hypothetical protein